MRRNDSNGADEWTHGLEGDCGWSRLNHPELCDQCMASLGDDPSWDILNDSLCIVGVQNHYESMEGEIVLSDLLGTAWVSVICVVIGIACGIYLYPWLKNRMGR